jgi:transposase
MTNKFPQVRVPEVPPLQEHRVECASLRATVESIEPKIGCVPQTLVDWFKAGQRDGLTIHDGYLAQVGPVRAQETASRQ